MKKRIAILAGGYSKEREISLLTGKEVNKVLKKKYFTKLLDPKGDLVKKLRQFKPDIVFNALHGRYGEDGYIQSILENERAFEADRDLMSIKEILNLIPGTV